MTLRDELYIHINALFYPKYIGYLINPNLGSFSAEGGDDLLLFKPIKLLRAFCFGIELMEPASGDGEEVDEEEEGEEEEEEELEVEKRLYRPQVQFPVEMEYEHCGRSTAFIYNPTNQPLPFPKFSLKGNKSLSLRWDDFRLRSPWSPVWTRSGLQSDGRSMGRYIDNIFLYQRGPAN